MRTVSIELTREVNRYNLLGGQRLIFLPKIPENNYLGGQTLIFDRPNPNCVFLLRNFKSVLGISHTLSVLSLATKYRISWISCYSLRCVVNVQQTKS